MKNMSFLATERQILDRSKTVTRRVGWLDAHAGQVVQPIRKGQGIVKGGRVTKLGGPIRFVSVRREQLLHMRPSDLSREGFPDMALPEFIGMFQRLNNLKNPRVRITRIEFVYVDESTAQS
jgi:hypothetical protein